MLEIAKYILTGDIEASSDGRYIAYQGKEYEAYESMDGTLVIYPEDGDRLFINKKGTLVNYPECLQVIGCIETIADQKARMYCLDSEGYDQLLAYATHFITSGSNVRTFHAHKEYCFFFDDGQYCNYIDGQYHACRDLDAKKAHIDNVIRLKNL